MVSVKKEIRYIVKDIENIYEAIDNISSLKLITDSNKELITDKIKTNLYCELIYRIKNILKEVDSVLEEGYNSDDDIWE